MNFGKILKQLRKDHNIDQNMLANHLNVTRQTIYMWESDKVKPNIETIRKISSFMDVPVSIFFQNEAEPECDIRYIQLGRLLKETSKEKQDEFYRIASAVLDAKNDKLFQVVKEEGDDTI